MGSTQSMAALSQAPARRPLPLLADAPAGPEAAINNFCNMARASSQASSASTASSGPGSAINDFCKLAAGAAPARAQKVRQPSATHAASVAVSRQDPLLPGDVAGVPPCGEDHQARTASRSSQASVSTADSGCSRSSSRSGRQAGADTFPEKMTSLDLVPTCYRATDFEFDTAADGQRPSEWSLKTGAMGFAAHRFLAPQLRGSEEQAIRGRISELHHITLSDEQLRDLGIVRDVRHFAFSYPVVIAQELKASAKDAQAADIAFLVFGGYMYFDADMVLRDVRAVIPSDDGCLRFGPPQKWLPQWTIAAGVDRWRPVTLPALRALGVRYFSWLRPGESVDGEALCCHGGFAYIFHEPSELGTLQAQLDVFFQLEGAADQS